MTSIQADHNFFEEAKQAFAEGRFEHAAELFLHGKALGIGVELCNKNWAICMVKLGRHKESLEVLATWCESHRDDLYALEHLGLACYGVGELNRAVELLETRIALGPMDDNSWLVYVDACERTSQLNRARTRIQVRQELDPQNLFSRIMLSRLHVALGETGDAIELLKTENWDSNVSILYELASIEKSRTHFIDANVYLARAGLLAAEQQHPQLEQLLKDRISIHVMAGEPAFVRFLAKDYLNRFQTDQARLFCLNSFIAKGMVEDAQECIQTIREPEKLEVEILFAKSSLDRFTQNVGSAIINTLEALKHRPNEPLLICGLGLLFCDIALPSLGGKFFESILELTPHCPQTRWNLAICEFLDRKYKSAFKNAEYRWQLQYQWGVPPKVAPTLTRESPIAGKRIYVYCEQGLGDTIQFVRFLSLYLNLGAELTLKVPEPLKVLIERSFPRVRVVTEDPNPGQHDYQVALLSLPYILGTSYETVPAPKRYIECSQGKLNHWKMVLGPKTRKRIAVAWSGAPGHKNDRNRSIAFSQFSKLFGVDADFYCIQKGVPEEIVQAAPGNLTILDQRIHSFDDSAAVMALCDLVISIDSSPIHLAGALGVKSWLLIPNPCDWRWCVSGAETVWYPSMTVYRQGNDRIWPNTLDTVYQDLMNFCSQE
jgi:tetratricopeptide (TPR) repeat protein